MDEITRKLIRQSYKEILDEIISNYPKTDVYFIDWISIFSKAEKLAWDDIRLIGAPLYPQFPVGPYFLDFADPVKKIAIEIDSAKFHLDEQKDDRRQKEIESLGWKVYRFNWNDLLDVARWSLDEFGEKVGEPYLESNFLRTIKGIYNPPEG